MNRFPLAQSRPSCGRIFWPILLIFALASLPGCTNSSLQSIQLIPDGGATLGVGASVQFKAIAVYTNGSHPPTTKDITGQVAWSSSIVQVASINAAGYATAVAPGITTITATGTGNLGVVTATTSITVPTATTPLVRDLVSIAITPASQTITGVGGTAQFVAIGTYSSAPLTQDLTATATWSSTQTSVATINSLGVATAVSAGTSTITATAMDNGGAPITTTATVTVSTSSTTTTAPGLVSVAIIPSTQTVNALGEASQFIAIGTYVNSPATTQDVTTKVTWISSDVSVATINAQGLATGNGIGTTAITALITGAGGATITGTATFTEATGVPPTGNVETLGVFKVGNGLGTVAATYVDPQNNIVPILSCGSGAQCVGVVPSGAVVTLTAAPTAPGTFGGWSNNCTVGGTPSICTLTMTNNETVAAIFNP